MEFKRKVLVIIPAFNEEGSIKKVIEELEKCVPEADLLVVNDGSTDGTFHQAQVNGATVLDLPFNLGIGAVMQAGYQYALKRGYDIAIQADGDGQHNPYEIHKLISALEEKEVDLVIGSRFLGDSEFRSTLMRRVGIFIISRIVSMIMEQKITDPTSGFRAINRKVIQLFAFDYPYDYPEPEVLVLLHMYGFKIAEVPVRMNVRQSGESSITKAKAAYYMVKVLLSILVGCLKKPHLWKGK